MCVSSNSTLYYFHSAGECLISSGKFTVNSIQNDIDFILIFIYIFCCLFLLFSNPYHSQSSCVYRIGVIASGEASRVRLLFLHELGDFVFDNVLCAGFVLGRNGQRLSQTPGLVVHVFCFAIVLLLFIQYSSMNVSIYVSIQKILSYMLCSNIPSSQVKCSSSIHELLAIPGLCLYVYDVFPCLCLFL